LDHKQISKAIKVYKRAFKIFPLDEEIALKIGSLYAYCNKLIKAKKYLNFVIIRNCFNYKANMTLAKLY